MTRASRRLLALAVGLSLTLGVPAASAGSMAPPSPGGSRSSGAVQVVLTATGPGPVTHGSGQVTAACPVTVAEGSDGSSVLDAAVASGCLQSYDLVAFAGLGNFVNCIDSVCSGPDPNKAGCWFWGMFENGLLTEYGVDGFRAAEGDVLSFAYVPWGPGLFCS